MTDREAILSAALEQPDDDTARLVLADFLREQPDPADVALGRFLWAGVVAGRYRSAGVIEDAEFYAALAEMSEVAADGWPARWIVSLGLAPPPAPDDWAWDNTADLVTVRVGRVRGDFARGMLIGLTVTLDGWSGAAPAVLAAWPVEWVAVADVPGMMFWVDPPHDGLTGWRLSASLIVHPRRTESAGIGRLLRSVFGGQDPASLPRVDPRRWSVSADFPNRPALVTAAGAVSAVLVAQLRAEAAGWWPIAVSG